MLAGNTNDVSENLSKTATPSQDKYHRRLTVASSSILGVPKVLMNIITSETTKDMIMSINTYGMHTKTHISKHLPFLSVTVIAAVACGGCWFVLCFSFLLYRSRFFSLNQSVNVLFSVCSQQGGMRLVFYIHVVYMCTLGVSTHLPELKNRFFTKVLKKRFVLPTFGQWNASLNSQFPLAHVHSCRLLLSCAIVMTIMFCAIVIDN